MKILFVFTEINQKMGSLGFQHGLASISATLKAHGYNQIDLYHMTPKYGIDSFLDKMSQFKPDIVGFYCTAEQFRFIKRIIEAIGSHKVFTICGGPHITLHPQSLEEVTGLDAICIGEGEYPMLELVEALEKGKDSTKIKNIWVKKNNRVYKNPCRPFVANLDELPFEDRDLFNFQESIDHYGLSQLRVLLSRGCPFNCTYCSNQRLRKAQSGTYVRFRSVDNVVEEIKGLKERYNFSEICFDDEVFMFKKEFVDEFCVKYKREITLPFDFDLRVEFGSKELLGKLKKAGGRMAVFGIESGNEEVRRKILKRKMSNQQIIEALRNAKEVGLKTKVFNMVGLPEETKEKFEDTIRLNRMVNPDALTIYVFFPYPGTEAYDICKAKGYLDDNSEIPDNYISRRDTILKMPHFTRQEILKCSRWFGFNVYKSHSFKKALAYKIFDSRYGDFIVSLLAPFRKQMRRFVQGS